MTWTWLMGRLRRLAANDARHAMTVESDAIRRATEPPRLGTGLARLAAPEGEERAGTVEVGTFMEVPDSRLLLPLQGPPIHSLTLGGTGVGKSRLLLGLIRAKLLAFAQSEDADRLVLLDPKNEIGPLTLDAVAALLPSLTAVETERLLSLLVVVDPFSSNALVPLNVLCIEEGTDLEAAAWDLAGLISRLAGSAMGIHQDDFTFNTLMLGMELARTDAGCTLLDLARLIDAPAELRAAGQRSQSAGVRRYFEAPRLPRASLHGVRVRLTRLLRLPGARRMFGASESVSFEKLLRDRVTILNMGAAPAGSRDIADFWMGLLMGRLVRAIFARGGHEPTACIFIDEWHTVVGAANWVAADFERILAVCRSRRAHLSLVSQSLDAVRKVSPALPHVALTNTDWRFLFRADAEDARAAAHLLPVTRRRPRLPRLPWEPLTRDPFFSATEERAYLIERLTRLRQREFLFTDRRDGDAGAFVRASEVTVERPAGLPAHVAHRIACGALALPQDGGPPPPRTGPGSFKTVVGPARAAGAATPVAPTAPPTHVRLPRRRRRVGG